MNERVTIQHEIRFNTEVEDGRGERHRLIAEEVVGELKLLAPLLIKERMMKLELEDLQMKIKEIRK